MSLVWSDVQYHVPSRLGPGQCVLSGVSGFALPGRILGILGPSGAGKTTLLKALVNRVVKTKGATLSGEVTLDSVPLSVVPKGKIAFIPQDDVFFSLLTVRETLEYAAELKFPLASPLTRREVVDRLLRETQLTKIADTVVGDLKIPGISGGEKKRLSIAKELIDSPSVLVLDEPTTGLDSYQAHNIVELLKIEASQNKTIILTIHQPRASIFENLDDVIFINDGKIVYSGLASEVRPYFEKHDFDFKDSNPAEFILDLLSNPDIKLPPPPPIVIPTNVQQVLQPTTTSSKNSFFSHFKTLIWRSWTQNIRLTTTNIYKILQSGIASLTIGLIFKNLGYQQSDIQSRTGVLQVTANYLGMTSLVGMIDVFGRESVIVHREIENGLYGLAPYFFAKVVAEIPFGFLTPTIFSSVLYPVVNLNPQWSNFFRFLGINILSTFTSTAFGMAIGSFSPNVDIALGLGKFLMMVFVIFGGLYINELSIKGPLKLIPKISIVKQSFQALCINEFVGSKFIAKEIGDITTGEQVLSRLSFDPSTLFLILRNQALFYLSNIFFSYLGLKWTQQKFVKPSIKIAEL